MTPCGESRMTLEATRPNTLLGKRAIRMGPWNVRTMYETGKTFQVAATRTYNLVLLGISETRWTQSGRKKLHSSELLLYSGHEDVGSPHTQGMALMLSKTAQKALIGWAAHGPRIIAASFKTKVRRVSMNVIQCYAPTNDSEDGVKDQFYHRLQSVIDNLPERDVTILMGDFNAKIASDNIVYEEVVGQHGLGVMSDNGERLADLCALNKRALGGSVFPHRRIHNATWLSPDQSTANQIDHFCISKKFRRSLQDVRVKRGSNAASDHHLVIANLKLKLKRNWAGTAQQRNRYDVGCLKDVRKLDEFRVTVKNRYQILQDLMEEDETVGSSWKVVKESFVAACKEVLGPKKYHHKDWISAETLSKIRTRKEKKAAVNSSRTRAERSRALKNTQRLTRAPRGASKQIKGIT